MKRLFTLLMLLLFVSEAVKIQAQEDKLKETLTYENINNISELMANKVSKYLENPLSEIRTISSLMSNIEQIIPPEGRRDMINFMLKNLLEKNPNYIAVWAVYEPNALDGLDARFVNTPGSDRTGRFLSYWTKNKGKITLETMDGYDLKGAASSFYFTSFRSGKEEIIDPYIDIINREYVFMTSITVPIIRNGQVIGVAGIDLPLADIQKMITELTPNKGGQFAVFTNNGMIVAHPDSSRLGNNARQTERSIVGDRLDDMINAFRNGSKFRATTYSPEKKTDIFISVFPFKIGNISSSWSILYIIPENRISI